ncbi:hypothetical protein C8Q78DRAFT_965359 [Trametes maxima]|nr:hypothetical protein C8Q78DRAFT_965359 [Trametes maxima]
MHYDKKSDRHPHLEINVNSDVLCLRGTGVDVNPALLSGNVVLHLSEPTAIKEITLSFRGKARLPVSAAEPLALSSSQLTYVVCNHEWSFLEGDRHHAHTLKAGRHLFPFQLQIGGSLPSSIYTSALGGASVQYKLRAQAIRGGFGLTHRDLTATLPVTIMRGFGSEALEYQQTLEIENTWPEKLMYSIMIPHKAWAAGERLTAVVKFQPLVKGARVLSVTTTINETVKLYARTGSQENTRVIASTKHDIVDGKAICVDEQQHRFRVPLLHGHSHVSRHSLSSAPSTPSQTPGNGLSSHSHHSSHGQGSYFPPMSASSSRPHSPSHTPLELAPLTTTTTNSSSSSGGAVRSGPLTSAEASAQASTNASSIELPPQAGPSTDPDAEIATDVVTTLNITVPIHSTPSHSLEPVQVSHRVRWSILIGNLDGHTSELRCSLPIHVLDHRLADEARAATLATRRLLLGATDVEGGQAVLDDNEEEDAEALPSYPSHVRDRVANAYLPDSAVMRVANAWVVNGISPTIPERAGPLSGGPQSESSSGMQSPAAYETWQVGPGHTRPPRSEHLPHEPQPGAHPLEWVNTELLLSLGREAPEAPPTVPQRATPPSRTPPESIQTSRHGSRFPSRRGSRANSRTNSRAASPERSLSLSDLTSTDGRSTSGGESGLLSRTSSQETFVHSHSTASRNMHGLFHIAMKPFTSLSSTFSLGSRSGSHANLQALQHGASMSTGAIHSPAGSASGTSTPAHPPEPMTTQQMLHHAFTQVPDYDMASRGFLGGGITPLSSLRDLPSYESVAGEGRRGQGGLGGGVGGGSGGGGAVAAGERSFSDGDLVGMFAARGVGAGAHVRPRPHPHPHPLPPRSALGRVEPRTAAVTP